MPNTLTMCRFTGDSGLAAIGVAYPITLFYIATGGILCAILAIRTFRRKLKFPVEEHCDV